VNEKIENYLFPEMLKSRWSVLFTAVIPSVVAFLVNALAFWIMWDEMKEPSRHWYSVALLVTSLLPAGVGLLTFGFRRKIHGFVQFAIGVCCLVHVIAFCYLVSKALPNDTPQWMVGDSFGLIQFSTMVPGIFITLWRIASLRTSLSPLKDFALSILVTAIGPGLLYAFSVCCSLIFRVSRDSSTSWINMVWKIVFPVIMVVAPVFFFIGLLRCLMWVRTYLVQKSQAYKSLQIAYIGAVALVFPIAGLLLNTWIPFPADFQNPWPYILTVLNAVVLMLPATGKVLLDRVTRFIRWAMMPFTFYFFIVFLPFMPFSLFAILFFGTGFLILAPTLLLVVHGQQLKRDIEEAGNAGTSMRGFYLRAVCALLILPACIVLKAEYDRSVLHRTLNFYYSRDDATDSRSPVSPGDVKRILKNVRAFKDGSEIPYLTNWYNWRVFDNLLLQDEKYKDLWRAYVDDNPPEKQVDGMFRNMFGELFGGRTRSPGSRFWGETRRVSRNVELTDVQTSSVTTNNEMHVSLRLSITSHDLVQQAEYESLIQLPASAWVAGLKLKIGTNWVDGRIVERKAAEWVYRQIRDERRDPAFLRYEGENLLKLSVFPVQSKETREVELKVVFPTGFADALTIGNRRVELSSDGIVNQMAYANGVLVASARSNPLQTSVWKEDGAYIILDCSKGQQWTDEALAKAFTRVKDDLKLRIRAIVYANYETRVQPVTETESSLLVLQSKKAMLPERGGLDLDAAVRRSASHIALSFTPSPDSWRVPKLVLLRNKMPVPALPKEHNWKASKKKEVAKTLLAPKVKEQSVRVANTWVPMLSPTLTVLVMDQKPSEEKLFEGSPQALAPVDAKQYVPVAFGEHIQWLSILGQKACVFTKFEDGLGVPAKGDGAEAKAKLKIWNPEGAQFVPLAPTLFMPSTGTWAQGALAWQLQTQLHLSPSKDDLRREILKQSWTCGVVTDVGSYIVVENSAQWKMLELKQRQTLAANAALDTIEASAPSMTLLLFGLIVFIAVRRLYGLQTRKRK
jgi:hypothetical protein